MSTFGDKIRTQQEVPLRMPTFVLSACCELTSAVPMPMSLKGSKGIFLSRKEISHLLWVTMGEAQGPSTLRIDRARVVPLLALQLLQLWCLKTLDFSRTLQGGLSHSFSACGM